MFIGFRFGNISFSKTDMVEPSENTAERILKDAGLYEYTVKDGKVKIENNLESMYMETRISHNKVKRVVGFSILSDIPCYGSFFKYRTHSTYTLDINTCFSRCFCPETRLIISLNITYTSSCCR